jgi:hypothetical protein
VNDSAVSSATTTTVVSYRQLQSFTLTYLYPKSPFQV